MLLSCGFAFAQAQQKEPVTINADTLLNDKVGEEVTHLVRNVRFVQGAISGTADEAFQYKQRNQIELKGNVNIHQDVMTLQAPILIYDGNAQIARAENGFYLVDRDASITALRGTYDLNNQRAECSGNVKANQGGSFMTSDSLVYFRSTQTSISRGNVIVTTDSGTLKAEEVTNIRATGEVIAKRNVELHTDSSILYCNNFYDAKHIGLTTASGNVSTYDLKNKTIIYGDTLARLRDSNYLIVPLHPLLLILDSTDGHDSLTGETIKVVDTLFVVSKVMEAYSGDSSRFIATDSVRLLKKNFSARGNLLHYNNKADLMQLAGGGRQRLWNDSTEITGDSVVMFMKKKKIDRLFALGKSFATTTYEDTTVLGRINQLSSKSMLLTITDDTVRSLLGIDNALSIYFVSSDGKPSGVNRASGDSIRIDFAEKKPNRVVVIHETEGEYMPERYVGSRGSAFRLGNYERHIELRPTPNDFLLSWKPKEFVWRKEGNEKLK